MESVRVLTVSEVSVVAVGGPVVTADVGAVSAAGRTLRHRALIPDTGQSGDRLRLSRLGSVV